MNNLPLGLSLVPADSPSPSSHLIPLIDRMQQINSVVQDQEIPLEQRVALLGTAFTEMTYGAVLQEKLMTLQVKILTNDKTDLEQSVAELSTQLDNLTAERDKENLIKSWQNTGRALNTLVLGPALYMAVVNPVSVPMSMILVGACCMYENTVTAMRVRSLNKEIDAYLESHPNARKTEALLYAKKVLKIEE